MNALALLALLCTAAAPQPSIRRLALLVGANDGGTDRVQLRYASSDAAAFAKVLDELGGVAAQERLLLTNATLKEVRAGLTQLHARAEQARGENLRVEVFVYYSGHSDEEGLLLRGQRLGYDELRRSLDGIPADVRVAVLDSCASGAFARKKGGVHRPAFLSDTSARVQGYAILTSSSADEASQESDRIGGSYFTHQLVSGLRGAADVTRDGRVTLNEAYQFAFHGTLERTERTQAGAQHPAYDIGLAGSGDLVMTDLRETSAGIVLSEELEGRLYIRDEQGVLVVELQKRAGRSMELGLAPGRYKIRRELDGTLSDTVLLLKEGGHTPLTSAAFRDLAREITVSRGTSLEPTALPPLTPVAFSLSFIPPLTTQGTGPEHRVETKVALGVVNRASATDGLALAVGANWHDTSARGLQLALAGNYSGGDLSGLQLGLGANVARSDMSGLQTALGLNMANGSMRGLQTSLGANVSAGNMRGLQTSLGANVANGSVRGLQTSLGANVVSGNIRGVQTSLGANVATQDAWALQTAVGLNMAVGSMSGLQGAVGANLVGQDMRGAQVAVGFNAAPRVQRGVQAAVGLNMTRRISGMQLALINVGGDVDGVQLGLLNVANTVRGAQLGLINFSQKVRGLSLGLISYEREGTRELEFFCSDIQWINVGVKFRGERLYTTLVAGMEGPVNGIQRFTLGAGLGFHTPFSQRVGLDLDAVVNGVHHSPRWFSETSLLVQARSAVSVELWRYLSPFAGLTLNMHIADTEPARPPLTRVPLEERLSNSRVAIQVWPGLIAGIRI